MLGCLSPFYSLCPCHFLFWAASKLFLPSASEFKFQFSWADQGICITKRAQLFLGYSDQSILTNCDNGSHDNRYPNIGHQLINSTQVRLAKSHEHAHIRGGFWGSRPIAIMSARWTEKRTAALILMKYEEEKSNILEKSNTVAAARRRQNAWQPIMNP